MAKSIHERVRAQLEKKARDEKRAAERASHVSFAREEKRDADFERGVEAYLTVGSLPMSASKATKAGFDEAARSEFDR
jgi:hypothetical protein